MDRIIRQLPNCITCLNLISGLLAVITAMRGDSPLWGLRGFEWAYIFIGAAAVADFLDGFAARMLHAYSDVGKELDSLCDLVSFGVAPALILFNCAMFGGISSWAAWAALLLPVAGAIRLARFNVDTRQTSSFIGLPIPANAIFWIGYTALAYGGAEFMLEWYVLLPAVAVVSWLMNSPLKMFSLKMKDMRWASNRHRYLLIAAAAVFVFCMGVSGLMWLIIFYVLESRLSFTQK